ncbi:MAG: diguanylate cyclase [Casimicrobiaceae bacterium]
MPFRDTTRGTGEKPPRKSLFRAPATPIPDRARELRFIRRIHRMRTLGLALGCLCVASVLHLHQASLAWWILLAVHVLAWPYAALVLATRSANPQSAEIRNLLVDSAMGGVWIAAMQFNLLPSVVLATMLSVDKVGVGGMPLLARTSVPLVAACLVTSALLGFPAQIVTPMYVMLACLPLLVVYPLALSTVTFTLASKLARQNRRLDELGRTDGLTGLANRRQCLTLAEGELVRHRRSGRPAVLVILDIDRFKGINDRYGHPIGDEVLRTVATILRESGRKSDTVARYGGDEFLMVLPDTDLAGAEEASRRIRARLESVAFRRAANLRCTVSLGAAEASDQTTDVDAWIQQADAALYRAKLAGRNRFAAATPVVAAGR